MRGLPGSLLLGACTAQVVDMPLTDADLNRRKLNCNVCRFSLAFFNLLIGDEVHEYKSRGSAQGIAAGVLADICGKSLSLSRTLMGS